MSPFKSKWWILYIQTQTHGLKTPWGNVTRFCSDSSVFCSCMISALGRLWKIHIFQNSCIKWSKEDKSINISLNPTLWIMFLPTSHNSWLSFQYLFLRALNYVYSTISISERMFQPNPKCHKASRLSTSSKWVPIPADSREYFQVLKLFFVGKSFLNIFFSYYCFCWLWNINCSIKQPAAMPEMVSHSPILPYD